MHSLANQTYVRQVTPLSLAELLSSTRDGENSHSNSQKKKGEKRKEGKKMEREKNEWENKKL